MFETLDLTITADDWTTGGIAWLSVVSPVGVTHRIPRLVDPELVEATARYMASIGRTGNAEVADTISRALSDLVFGVPEIRSIFARSRGAAAVARRSLLVHLLPTPHQVARFPWELIADPDGGPHRFLALAPDVVVARSPRVRTRSVRSDPLPLPLRMLVIASNPPLAPPDLQFDAYEDRRAVLDELEHLRESGHVKVTLADPPTIEGIRRTVAEESRGFHVVHFTGHATSDALVLEKHDGRPHYVDASTFCGLLQECPDLRVLVLAGCETSMHGDPAKETPDSALQQLSMAESCARDVCDNVIGMQAKLPFVAERIFVSCLYRALAGGRTVGEAVRLARAAVRDDRHAGLPRLDFSVPTLMVAGTAAGALVDSESPSSAVPIHRARIHKEKLFERDPSLVARPAHLRTLVDFLNGRTQHRLLQVVGPPRAGKTDLVARAMREIEETTDFVIYCRLIDLASDSRRVGMSPLAGWIRELFSLSATESWAVVVERVIDNRFAIVVDDAEELKLSEQATIVGRELYELLGRHGDHRVALVRRSGYELPISDRYASLTLNVPELPPDDVQRWVTRHLPSLRMEDRERFAELSRKLGSDLELWRELSRRVDMIPKANVNIIADELVTAQVDSRRAMAVQQAETEPVRVAVAGDLLAGRQEPFANAVLRIASRYGVAARLDTPSAQTAAAPFGILLEIPSPISNGSGRLGDILKWMDTAVGARAAIILADFGSQTASESFDRVSESLREIGTLMIAAGGNGPEPVWPAWSPTVLAVGALDENGRLAYDNLDPVQSKPDLFAPGYSTGTDLEGVPAREGSGSSYAAMHALLAAIVVLAAGGQSIDVRETLLASATGLTGVPGARLLNLDAAMLMVQTQAVAQSLKTGPGDLIELAARTGLAGSRIESVVASLVAEGAAERVGDTVRGLRVP